jgi:hypothetical protein
MINNIYRAGNFTSSENGKLMTYARNGKDFGTPALTYIEETNMERKLGRSLCDEVTAKPLTWGNLLESRAFELLGLEYILSSTETDRHPTIDYWSGSKDGIKHDAGGTVIDIKCPITLKSFCQLVDGLYNGLTGMDAVNYFRDKHKDGDRYYWQLVSNSILNNTKFAELVVYAPYYSELQEIKSSAQHIPWIAMAADNELTYLLDDGYYKNLNIIRFEVSQEDKQALTDRIVEAGKRLIQRPSVFVAKHEPELQATIIE